MPELSEIQTVQFGARATMAWTWLQEPLSSSEWAGAATAAAGVIALGYASATAAHHTVHYTILQAGALMLTWVVIAAAWSLRASAPWAHTPAVAGAFLLMIRASPQRMIFFGGFTLKARCLERTRSVVKQRPL